MRRSVLILVSALALAGCATYVDSTHQRVEVVTPGVIGVDCYLKTHDNLYRVITPTSVIIQRSPQTIHVECKKTHYYPVTLMVKSTLHPLRSAATLPGAPYDFLSQAVYRYPDTIEVPMEVDPYAIVSTAVHEDPEADPLQKKPVEEPIRSAPPDKPPAEKTMNDSLKK